MNRGDRLLIRLLSSYYSCRFSYLSLYITDRLESSKGKTPMDSQQIRERVALIESKRESLVRLLEKPNLGTLRIDVNQALEEIDELIEEFKRTFPESE